MNHKPLKFYLILITLLLASLACGRSAQQATPQPQATPPPTAAPTNTPEPSIQLGDEYRSEEGGFSFLQVPGWLTDEFFGFASHAPADADPDLGPTFLLIGGLNEEDYDLNRAFADFSAEFTADSSQDMRMGTPFDTTVSGAPARGVDITGTNENGIPMAGRVIIVLVTSRQTLVAFGAATQDIWDQETAAYFNAVVDSLAFFEPVVEPGEIDGDSSLPGGEELPEFRQWASRATASSEYSSWTATQATGAPDIYPECGDISQAWASATSNGRDWLEVYYDIPVLPTEINIYETHSPDQVVSVEVVDLNGTVYNVYTGEPNVHLECQKILSVSVDLDVLIDTVRVTVDQQLLPWTEIDAIELVGLSSDDLTTLPTQEPASDPITFTPPDGFLWRLGGESGISDNQYAALGGMDVDSNGYIYMADNIHGIWIYDSAGNLIEQIDHNVFNNVNDVSVSDQAGGFIVATSWGNNSVFVMDYNGNILVQFGTEGNGPGQFGGFSPDSVTIDFNNNIYILDSNDDANGNDWTRVQVFDLNGNYLREWTVEDDFFAATTVEYWAGPTPADDRIYVLGFVGGYIIEYDLQGNKIREIGEDALGFTGPQDLAMDWEGNFYVTLWTPDSVVKLDHDGNLLAQWGIQVDNGDSAWPEGGFYQTGGVAVSPDGTQVYANDWSGKFAYLTAFQFK